jgi:putative endopeptidase
MLLRLSGAVAALALAVPALASSPGAPHGFNLSYIDHSCAACDDFYQFAVGNYPKLRPIPADRTRIGSFDDVYDRNLIKLHAIVEAAAGDASAAGIQKQVGDYYASCMDTAAIEARGAKPILARFAAIDAIGDRKQLSDTLAGLHNAGFGALFRAGVGQDDKESTRYAFFVSQGGLGLPDRDYYFKDDERTKAARAAYEGHIKKMFTLAGYGDAAGSAAVETIMRIETALAKVSRTRVALRDPQSNYNKMTFAQLAELTGAIDWPAYLTARDGGAATDVVVGQPEFFRGLQSVLAATPPSDIKTYLKWRVLSANGLALPAAFDDEDFAYSSALNGQKQQRPRWQRCVASTDSGIGEALGRLYVAQAFTPQAKERARALVTNVQAVLRDDIAGLDWMSAPTKQAALAKLDAYTKKIGYPDQWIAYTFPIGRDDFYANLVAASRFRSARDFQKLGKPIDRGEWGMTPPTVNAYYDTSMNEIVFPAGILQAPFYDPAADDAYNYGGIGVVIGHEMTHGFDDGGSQYDADGNLKPWWTPEDKTRFDARANCVAAYFDTLDVAPGLKQNGKLVEGEAIADLGGATIAYKAYQRSLGGKPAPLVDGYTGDQRFFLGFAQVWAVNEREETLRLLAATDGHPAPKNRVNGTLSNMAEFADAWHCPMKAAMVRPASDRCKIW